MSRNLRQLILLFVAVGIGFAAVAALSDAAEQAKPQLPAGYEDSDLAVQGKRLKGYALGAEGLIADWYWILSLQYIGGKIVRSGSADIDLGDLRGMNPRLLYPYLDNATDLDPKFFAAYSYGAVVLPAIDTRQAITLTEKGIANDPDQWRLYQYLGYIYWRTGDYQKASAVYEKGASLPGAPEFMYQMAAEMQTRGGSRETARAMYTQMLNGSEDEQSKRSAEIHLAQIDALDQIDAVNAALANYRSTAGRCPSRLSEIYPRLASSSVELKIDQKNDLVDPTGIPYSFDQTNCTIAIDTNSKIPKDLQ